MVTAGIKENVERVREEIAAAAQRTGRQTSDIVLCAVTKGASVAQILEAKEAGITVFAENRVQEAQEKIAQVPAEWHMIGHLQSNKIKPALALFQAIQSVDTLRLAEKLNEELLAEGRTLPVLLEVNVSGEEQKHGFSPMDIYSAVDGLAPLTQLQVKGLMGIAPNVAEEAPKREAFKKLKSLSIVLKGMKKERLEMRTLSMGMSDDYVIAIEEGSNFVRLGRAIFGERKK
jgi:PLP dependent protein